MRILTFLATVFLATVIAGTARSATFTISPVSISLESGQKSAEITVRNDSTDPMTVQVRVYRWTQAGDEDLLNPTSDIILSPPVAAIPVGGVQTLRLLLRANAAVDVGHEREYRILLDQIPAVASRPGQLGLTVRTSIPLFVLSKQATEPKLQWRAERSEDGITILSASNTGISYDRVFEVAVTSADGTVLTTELQRTNTYVLPHSRSHWVVRDTSGSRTLRLSTTTRGRKSDQILAIGP